MANIKSAKKRVLVNKTKREENLPIKSTMKTAVKKAIVEPNEDTVKEANKRIDKALSSGIIKKNKAARLKSRVSKNLSSK